jgi:hypothetical protein
MANLRLYGSIYYHMLEILKGARGSGYKPEGREFDSR